ncbi:MAG TPA: phage holin family protein [Tepidisphaeraceae bacterium]|nr:phage holin family protein [Tepidisphaeraceae bacterium]
MSAQTESSGPPPSAGRTGWEQRPDAGMNPMPPPAHPSDAIRDAFAKLAELREFAAYYVAARVDALKLTARRIGIYAALGLVGAVAGATVVITAVVLLLRGIAGAFASLFRPELAWLGDLITAVIFLAIPVIGILIGMRILTRTFKTSTVHKYEERQRHQRQQFGRDVRDEATAARRSPGKTQ